MKFLLAKGFTLVELAIGLAILGLIALTLIGPLTTAHEQEERFRNQQQLDEIREALLGHAVEHGYLPCPDCRADALTGTCTLADSGDFNQDLQGTALNRSCKTLVGNLPAAQLGVPAQDVWQRPFRYALSGNFSNESPPPLPATLPPGTPLPCPWSGNWFGICTPGDLKVTNKPTVGVHACPATAPPATITQITNIAAVVISEGKKRNDIQPLSCFEQRNIDPGTTPNEFVAAAYSSHQDPSNPTDETRNYYFDDMVTWISAQVLRSRMVAAGKLP